MSDTTFIDHQTPIVTPWLQDVNDTVYKALGAPKTIAETIANLGAAKQSDLNTTNSNVSTNSANIQTNANNLASSSDRTKGSSLVGYLQNATHAVGQTAQNKLDNFYVNVKDWGAKGDGATDDTTAIKNAIADMSGGVFNGTAKGFTLYFPRGTYVISSTVEVPPNCILLGEAIFANNISGSVIKVNFNGIGIRFIRRETAATDMRGQHGAENLVFQGPGNGTSVHLVELGDSTKVDSTDATWSGFIRNCHFNYTLQGYGIYAANSQEWVIEHNTFLACLYPVWYATVPASARIRDNSFDDSQGLGGIAIRMAPGTMGGTAGPIIDGNYFIDYATGVRLVSIVGASVVNNTFEGQTKDAVVLTEYLEDETTVSGSGCESCHVHGNNFINWCAGGTSTGGGGYAAIKLEANSYGNFIGHNDYRSPNAYAGSAIGVYGSGIVNNTIFMPRIYGNNNTIPPVPVNNSIMGAQFLLDSTFIQVPAVGGVTTTGWGNGERGRIFLDANNNPVVWDGAETRQFLSSKAQTTSATAGGATALPATPSGYLTITVGTTDYKVPIYGV